MAESALSRVLDDADLLCAILAALPDAHVLSSAAAVPDIATLLQADEVPTALAPLFVSVHATRRDL